MGKAINIRAKGQSGERQFCKWLYDNFGIEAERDLEQVRSGGGDIYTQGCCFEIKRVESLDIQAAWTQCVVAARKHALTPILAYRKNNQPWSFCIAARNIGLRKGSIQLNEFTFKLWFEKYLIERHSHHGS